MFAAPLLAAATTAAGTAGTLSTALTIGGGIISALGAIQQANAESSASKFNARMAERNAEITRQETIAASEKQDRERRLRAGANIAKAGAGGRGSGAFGDIMSSNAMQEELDLLTLKNQGLLKEQDYMADASLSRSQAKSAKVAGYLGAGTSLLSASSQAMRDRAVYGKKSSE